MKRTFAAAAALLVSTSVLGQTSTGTRAPAPAGTTSKAPATTAKPPSVPVDSPLVAAAKAAKAKKSRISLSDSDIKKTTGKLILVSASPEVAAPQIPLGPEEKPAKTLAELEADQRRRQEAEALVTKFEKEVASLEKELARIEDDYYTEDNLDFRDETIASKFSETKKLLETARHQLTDARTAASGSKP